jgi:hypothetical protein
MKQAFSQTEAFGLNFSALLNIVGTSGGAVD